MIGNLNHVAIAVPDLEAAILLYQNVFGAFVLPPQDLPSHGARVAMVKLPNTTIELITPLEKSSPLQKFLKNNPQGGLHHLCYEVSDIKAARDHLTAAGLHATGDGKPKPGYHGNPVLFFQPKDSLGVLIELEEIPFSQTQEPAERARIGPIHTPHKSSSQSLAGVDGIGVGIDVDFKRDTPKDDEEGE